MERIVVALVSPGLSSLALERRQRRCGSARGRSSMRGPMAWTVPHLEQKVEKEAVKRFSVIPSKQNEYPLWFALPISPGRFRRTLREEVNKQTLLIIYMYIYNKFILNI